MGHKPADEVRKVGGRGGKAYEFLRSRVARDLAMRLVGCKLVQSPLLIPAV